MRKAYSQDLRERALAAMRAGHQMQSVSQLFGVHRDTLRRWKNQYAATGQLEAIKNYQKGHSHKIRDWARFREFVEEHGDKTQAEMAVLWPDEVSEDTIRRGLKRLGITRKKRPTPIRNATTLSV